MKILIVGDLHGAIPKITHNEFDMIICPGDIFGDDIRPYIKKWIIDRTKLKKENYELPFENYCSIKKQKELHKESVKKGKEVLKFLNSFNKPVILVPGNWDPTKYQDGDNKNTLKANKNSNYNEWKEVVSKYKNIIDVEHIKKEINGITFIGHGSTSAPEPLIEIEGNKSVNKRVKYFKKIMSKLMKLFEKTNKPIIFISHNVPHKTRLDKVYAPGTYAHNKHYGSRIARILIEKYQPMLCVGGHIHEGWGLVKLKKTLCVNAGFGEYVNTIVTIDDDNKKILKIDFFGKNKKN